MKVQLNFTTKKFILILTLCFTHLILLAQQPIVIKARAYDTESTYAFPNPDIQSNDKNWALSIIELQNPTQGFGVAGFRTRFLTRPEFGTTTPGSQAYLDAEIAYNANCSTPGENCVFKRPTILKLDANLEREWEYSFDFPSSRQFTTVVESNNGAYLFGGANGYIGRVVVSQGANQTNPLDFRLLSPPPVFIPNPNDPNESILLANSFGQPLWTSTTAPSNFQNFPTTNPT